MAYVLRTDRLSKPYYFSGMYEGDIADQVSICPIVFEALQFDTKGEAERCIDDLGFGDDFTISQVGEIEYSDDFPKAGRA